MWFSVRIDETSRSTASGAGNASTSCPPCEPLGGRAVSVSAERHFEDGPLQFVAGSGEVGGIMT